MILYFGSHAISDAIHTARYSGRSGVGTGSAGLAVGGGFSAQNRLLRLCVRFARDTGRDTRRDTDRDTAPDTGPDLAISNSAGLAYPVPVQIAGREVMPGP